MKANIIIYPIYHGVARSFKDGVSRSLAKKIKQNIIIFCLLIISIMFSVGCISFNAHPVGIQPSAKNMNSPYYEIIGEAEGISSEYKLFWLFPVTSRANTNEAIDNAIKSMGGDNLIETVITRESNVYIVGIVNNIYVKGKVIRYLYSN